MTTIGPPKKNPGPKFRVKFRVKFEAASRKMPKVRVFGGKIRVGQDTPGAQRPEGVLGMGALAAPWKNFSGFSDVQMCAVIISGPPFVVTT